MGAPTNPAEGTSKEVFWNTNQPTAATIADGADVAEGATTDAIVAAGAAGTLSAKLRRVTQGLEDLKSLLVLAAGENHIGAVGGHTTLASANFTRPADTTAYASGDLVANSTTAGSVTPMQFTVARVAAGSGMIRRARLRKSGTSVTSASFRLHLYRASPTPANGDNAAWSTDQVANYLGSIDVTCDRAFTDGASGNGVPNTGSEINFKLSSGQVVYGLCEARAAYTPASGETLTWELEVLQN